MKPGIPLFLFLASVWVNAFGAGSPAERPFHEEASKQTAIYGSVGGDVPEGYVVGRSLLSYSVVLSPEFRRSLAELGPGDRWLDIGAGEGRAILDYVTSKYDAMLKGPNAGRKKAKAVAISIEDRRTPQWYRTAAELQGSQIDYLSGRRLREYSADELGQFQLVTDVLGAFSYTRYPSVFMEKTLGALAVNGSFYTLLQDVRSESGTDDRPFYTGAPFLTEVANTDGSSSKMCTWLKSISCVEVTCDLNAQSAPPSERYHVKKVCDNVNVPGLVLTHFQAGTPPERRFMLQSPATASGEGIRARR